jgi:mono/diheme cytochrome c family protein
VKRSASIVLTALSFGCSVIGCSVIGCSDPPSSAGPGELPGGALAAYPRPEYATLTETGVYADMESRTLADGLRGFEPSFVLWADGAEKQRWLALPSGSQIDTSDMNRWQFPIGTRAVKEFSVNGVPLETRLVERYGTGRDDYWMGAFVWREDQRDADFVEAGQEDVLGTAHDAPAQERCPACHNGEPGRFLGVSALQLSTSELSDASGTWTLESLGAEQRLSAPPPPGTRYAPPGDETTRAALGYLHANCGHCHNPRGTSWPDTQMLLRLNVEESVAEDTGLFRSVVGQSLQYYRAEAGTLRVVPGEPDASALIQRMGVRGPKEQMPPLATEAIDPDGVLAIRRWIASLVPEPATP